MTNIATWLRCTSKRLICCAEGIRAMDENPQQLLFAESGSDADRLWTAWLAADERSRRNLSDRIRAEFLAAAQKARRQAKQDGRRKRGTA